MTTFDLDQAPFPVEGQRAQFPALQSAGRFVFLDNAAGAQVPQRVLDAVNRHLLENNVQRGGRYRLSMAVDRTIAAARERVAALINARRSEEIAFGMNATSFIRQVSLAIGQTLDKRPEIIVTDLDHEANVATWLALERMGAGIRWWRARDDGRLYPDDLRPLLGASTRLVACTFASNAIGSIVDIRTVAGMTHAAGGELFVDAVHYGPHGPIDVQALDCDYLVCSGYKIFSPHMGFLWGRYAALRALPTFREDFIPDEPPGKLEAGTFVYENVAGMAAAVDYLATLGRRIGGRDGDVDADPRSLRQDCREAMLGIQAYERTLSAALLERLEALGAKIYGISDPKRVHERVPTVCFNLPGRTPAEVVAAAAEADIGIRDGHMYAPRLMQRLGLPAETGAVRVSAAHYNTVAEIDRLGQVLERLRAR